MVTVAPSLLRLRAQIDEVWPNRSRVSDGTLGDAAHAARASDHNDGNALDITNDPANGPDLEGLADILFQDSRVRYVIFNKRIANAAFERGAWRAYNGANPHAHHLHVSIHPAMRNDVSDWPNHKAHGWEAQA